MQAELTTQGSAITPADLAAAYDRAGRAFVQAAGHCRGTAELIRAGRWQAAEHALGLICDRLGAGMDTLGLMDSDLSGERVAG